MQRRLAIRIADGGASCEVRLQADHVDLVSSTPFSSPVTADDVESVRWLLEDHPRLRSPSTNPRAARIADRISELGRELGTRILAGPSAAEEIAALIGDPEFVAELDVRMDVDPATAWIPWESMILPGSDTPASIAARSFVRSGPERPPADVAPPRPNALRVLLVVSRPAGRDDVPFRSVASRIVRAAGPAEGRLSVEVLRPATFAALDETLARAMDAGTPYDVVHFDGHGVFRKSAFGPAYRGYLRFEANDGGPDEVDGRTVGETLVRHSVGVLLLNACRSAFSHGGSEPDGAFGSLATDAMHAGLGAVLAMSFNIYVVSAAQLIADLYRALGAGRSVAEAVTFARRSRATPSTEAPDDSNNGSFEGAIAGSLDWLVAVLYDSGVAAFTERRDEIPALPVTTSTTTASNGRVIDPGGRNGPRDDARSFYGRDGTLLRLERAIVQPTPVELIGLAGSGKSAVVAEFARWWCATGGTPAIAAVVDVGACRSFADIDRLIAARRTDVQPAVDAGPVLWILDGTDATLGWPEADRKQLTEFLDALAQSGGRALLTGRAPADLGATTVIELEGLDDEARRELAVEVVGESAVRDPATVPVLEWTDGVPALVRALPDLLRETHGLSLHETHEVVGALRGIGAPGDLHARLRAASGVEIFDVRSITSATLPLVAHLYQGFISTSDWTIFAQLAAAKGLSLTPDDEFLHSQLAPAQQAGLACRTSTHRYLLHPLAPGCLQPGYNGTIAVLANLDPETTHRAFTLVWGLYCQAVSIALRSPEMGLDADAGIPARRYHRQNLWHAANIALKAPWWGLAFPLLRLLRPMLLEQGRVAEWEALVATALATVDDFPPDPAEMGPEDLTRHLGLLRADAELFRAASDLPQQPDPLAALASGPTAQIVAGDPDAVSMVDEDGNEVGHLEANRQFRRLMQLGDASARHRSADCVAFFTAALDLAQEYNDLLRIGEAQLALGRAHLNVPEIRDFAEYERYARLAVDTGHDLAPFGADLICRGKLGLGNAITEQLQKAQLQDAGALDAERLREARAALAYAATAPAGELSTKASAHNGLGLLAGLESAWSEAANQYLQAAAGFEALERVDDLVVAQANAAAALVRAGQPVDARDIADQARRNRSRATRVDERTVAILDSIASDQDPPADEK